MLQVSAVVIGYVAGTAIGDLYSGSSTFALWRHSARSFASYLVLCIAISTSISYFFLSRGKDQRRLREIATAQRDAAEARLKLLESQLEPHMLFNTLANLRALIGARSAARAGHARPADRVPARDAGRVAGAVRRRSRRSSQRLATTWR